MNRLYSLFLLLGSGIVTSEIFAVKDAGTVGYFGDNERWKELHDSVGKKQADQVFSSTDGLWVITNTYKNRRSRKVPSRIRSVYKKENVMDSDKWIGMRKSFYSLTARYKNAVIGVAHDGNLYQCPHTDCNDPDQKWDRFKTPEMTTITEKDPNIGTKIRQKLKMTPLKRGKLDQLTAFEDLLYGKDEIGNLWRFDSVAEEWNMEEMEFLLKWIHITENDVLYVITENDNKPYRIDMETKEYQLISDGNDFEQIVFDHDTQRIWALNYYQQIFYLNEEGTDWVYVNDGIKHISVGNLPIPPPVEEQNQEIKVPDPKSMCICTAKYDPICCDGKQYSNPCNAECDGISRPAVDQEMCIMGECEKQDL